MGAFMRSAWFASVVLFSSASIGAQALDMTPIPDDNSTDVKVVHGTPAEAKEWPVTLQFRNTEGAFCTSTIVGEQVVITAAHCVDNGAFANVIFNNASVKVQCTHHKEYKGPACITATTASDIKGCTADVALCSTVDVDGQKKLFKTKTDSGETIRFETINKDRSVVPAIVEAQGKIIILGYGCTIAGGPISSVLIVGDP